MTPVQRFYRNMGCVWVGLMATMAGLLIAAVATWPR